MRACSRGGAAVRVAVAVAVLVALAGVADEIREHRVADRARHRRVGQRVEADVHDELLVHHLLPVPYRALVLEVEVVRREQLRALARGQLLQERQQRGDQLVEVGALVAQRRAQAGEHVVGLPRHVRAAEHPLPRHQPARPAFEVPLELRARTSERRLLGVDLAHDVRTAGEERVGVAQHQVVDVHDVAVDGPVVGPLAERRERPGDDVHEPPHELPEDGRLALAGHLARDPRGHLGDAAEVADAVVARRLTSG